MSHLHCGLLCDHPLALNPNPSLRPLPLASALSAVLVPFTPGLRFCCVYAGAGETGAGALFTPGLGFPGLGSCGCCVYAGAEEEVRVLWGGRGDGSWCSFDPWAWLLWMLRLCRGGGGSERPAGSSGEASEGAQGIGRRSEEAPGSGCTSRFQVTVVSIPDFRL